MKYYTVVDRNAVVEGTLHLTDAQHAARKGSLKPVKDAANRFETLVPVGFKKGEVFGWDKADLPRQLRSALEPVRVDFAKRIETERAAAASAREKALAARAGAQAPGKAAGNLFAATA